VASLEEPDRRLPGLDVVLHPQVDTHKKPPISHVQEMGGSSEVRSGGSFMSKDALGSHPMRPADYYAALD
ncbi:MAG: hypothetical protein PUH75_07440, partial [Collinsella sp.]|nr:hypothetical protein [Collinsella sp.]MDY5438236.1 hypothetical protein [Collinsella sp.]